MTQQDMLAWCETLVAGQKASPDSVLIDYLNGAPRLESLSDLPSGTVVLVRADVDAKPGDQIGQGDIRLLSMVETLQYGQKRGWKMVLFGHIGRKPEGSLDQVALRLGQLLDCQVPLIADWLEESSLEIKAHVSEKIAAAEPGAIFLLENTRQYAIERALWKAESHDLPELAPQLAQLANEFAEKIARVYVFEALSAGSLDASSTVVPAAMDRVALGQYVASEFTGPMLRCLEAELVVFSGLKIDKLDDLEAMVNRGNIRLVLAAGSLAMALRKGVAQIDGHECCLGVAENPDHAEKPYYIPPERIEQARRMIADGRAKGIEFVVPVDSVLEDGSVTTTLGPNDQQFDIGPQTSELFEQKVGQFLASGTSGKVAFHNGVFGMFEDPRFEEGTRRFVSQLKRMKDAGVEVYIGGGEGGKSLEKYGQPDWVTHVFTAGGTVLNALGSEPVPYLVALRMAAMKGIKAAD